MRYRHEITGGAAWSAQVPAGHRITLTAQGPNAIATMLLFAADRLDRLNVPDTMKAQMSACITPPMVLMSDRGTALASVVAATRPWHDCLTGFSDDRHISGRTSYGLDRNDWRRPARTLLLLELAKYGLGEADLHAPVNWFVGVGIADDPAASMTDMSGPAAGDQVVLRTEQDVLIVVSTAPHPFAPDVVPDPVGFEVGASDPADADASRRWREESARALEMSARVAVMA